MVFVRWSEVWSRSGASEAWRRQAGAESFRAGIVLDRSGSHGEGAVVVSLLKEASGHLMEGGEAWTLEGIPRRMGKPR